MDIARLLYMHSSVDTLMFAVMGFAICTYVKPHQCDKIDSVQWNLCFGCTHIEKTLKQIFHIINVELKSAVLTIAFVEYLTLWKRNQLLVLNKHACVAADQITRAKKTFVTWETNTMLQDLQRFFKLSSVFIYLQHK